MSSSLRDGGLLCAVSFDAYVSEDFSACQRTPVLVMRELAF